MAYTLKDAKQVCTKAEYEFVRQSHSKELAATTPARLRQKIARARKLRDKYRDESARQRREARGKAQPRGTRAAEGNIRTVQKAEIFADVLARITDALADQKVRSGAESGGSTGSRSGKKPVAKAAKKTAKKTTKKTTKKKSGAAGQKSDAGKTSKAVGKKTAKAATRKVSKKSTVTATTAKMLRKKSGTKISATSASQPKGRLSKQTSAKRSAAAAGQPAGLTDRMASSEGLGDTRPRRPTKGQAAAKGPSGETKPPSAIKDRFEDANVARRRGHVSQRTRVGQARRDGN